MAIKEDVIKALQSLPENATADEIADRVYFVLMVERRLAETSAGIKISDAEARERLKHWLE